ncbi:MAG: Gmad2 immunoglobulin-like domain-containing protein [Gemmatimonadota bacterium]
MKTRYLLSLLLCAACSRQEAPAITVDSTPTPVTTDTVPSANTSDLIRVDHPAPNTTITTPLTISGQARGTWFFEASFPVILVDASGDTLAVKPARAQGEWMTENFVPFTVTLDFAAPASATGTLILRKDNPSGLPEHDAEIRIPLRFTP